jgi:AraC-like DNA-binding protein
VELTNPDTRVAAAANDRLWAVAVERLDEPDLGLRFAQRMDIDSFHLVGHLALSSRTIGEALDRIVAYSKLLHDAGRTELERRDGEVMLFPGCRGLPSPPPRQIAEFSAASAVLLVRAAAAVPEWRPLRIDFVHPAPTSTRTHREVLGVVPSFGAAEDTIVLDEATLALPILAPRDAQLSRYLEEYAKRLIATLCADESHGTLRGQVLRAVVAGLGQGDPISLAAVAARLAMTPRTLQRRLAETGDAFAALLDEARHAAACRHLSDGALPLAEISYLLGFQDPATFSKAFKRWTGVTPGAYRERVRRQQGAVSG